MKKNINADDDIGGDNLSNFEDFLPPDDDDLNNGNIDSFGKN